MNTAWRRGLAIDAAAFALIAIAIISTRYSVLHHGINFNDSSWYFHFGKRALEGEVPYRDFVFQVGPLPIYVDAAAQAVFGSHYVSSYYAALTIHILRVFTLWLIVRRLVGWQAAAFAVVFGASDLWFGFAHHWTWAYVQWFTLASATCIVTALRTKSERAACVWLGCAGFWVGLAVSARQASLVTLAAVLLLASGVWLARGQISRARFAALWIGVLAALLVVFGALAVMGALRPAIQQMFLDAAEKKSSGLVSVLDALSGGSFFIYQTKWWVGGLRYLVMPCLVAGVVGYLAARPTTRAVSSRAVGLLLVPVVCLALGSRQLELTLIPDMPRTLFSGLLAVAVIAPGRFRCWFGVEPLLAVATCGFALASDWALEMSYPGRGWTDWESYVTAILVFTLASAHVPSRPKHWLCGIVAVLGLLHVWVFARAGLNPFSKQEASEGPLEQTRFTLDDPIFEGLGVSEGRWRAVTWLRKSVPAGSTCFIYGTTPILYDVLHCTNPTRIDTTIPDFITARDARDAIDRLRAAPPDFLISHESTFLHPPLSREYSPTELNPAASRTMHTGLRELLDQYEEVGYVGDVLGPDLSRQTSHHWDRLHALRVYRRRGP